jgi:hypothetical protein
MTALNLHFTVVANYRDLARSFFAVGGSPAGEPVRASVAGQEAGFAYAIGVTRGELRRILDPTAANRQRPPWRDPSRAQRKGSGQIRRIPHSPPGAGSLGQT